MTGQQCRGKIGIDGTVKNVVANQQSTTAPKIVWIDDFFRRAEGRTIAWQHFRFAFLGSVHTDGGLVVIRNAPR